MPEKVKQRVHSLSRCNKYDWGIIFADRDNKPINEDNNAYYNPNNYPTPEDDVSNLDNYVPNNLPAGVNDGDNTYENPGDDSYENPNFGDENYYAPPEEDE